MIDRGALCLGVEGLASNRDGSSEGARSVSMTGEEVERWGRGTYDCATWSRFDWYIFGRTFAAQLPCPWFRADFGITMDIRRDAEAVR